MNKPPLVRKLDPNRVSVECGPRFRHAVVDLTGEQTFTSVREQPEVWTRVQERFGRELRRGDKVTMIASDGLSIAESFVVTRAQAGKVWLGEKPLRIVQLESDALFTNGVHAVEPLGTGYAIKTVRDGHVEQKVYSTTKAAEVEIVRRQPTRAA